MKRFIAVAAILAAVGLSTPAFAVDELGLFVGATVPRGETAEEGTYGQKTGWEAGAFFLRPLNRSIALRADLSHRQLPNKVEIEGVSPMKITELAIHAKIRTCDRYSVMPYLLAGVGVAHVNILVDQEREDIHVTSSSTEMAIHAGAGLDFGVNDKMGLFVEAMIWESYYISLVPVRGGLRLML